MRGPPPQQAFTFVLVNIHVDPDETDVELDTLAQVYQAVRRAAGGEDDIIVLGDLNVDDQHLGQLGRLDGVRQIVRGMPTNTRGTALYVVIALRLACGGAAAVCTAAAHASAIAAATAAPASAATPARPAWPRPAAARPARPGGAARRTTL